MVLDPTERSDFRAIYHFYSNYILLLRTNLRSPARLVYTTLGCRLVETTPIWAWPIEVRVFTYLLYKKVSTSLLGQEI
ncbi:hypothetical protein Hanom_Chr08g00706261 [Helianthus anomalus]